MVIPKEAVANYCSFSLFFFASTEKGSHMRTLKKYFQKLIARPFRGLTRLFWLCFSGEKCELCNFFSSNSHHRLVSSSKIQILCTTFFNHFEESLDLYFAMFSTASTVGDRSHYLIAIASTRQSTCLTGEKISCNPWTNSPSLLKKDCAPLQINFFYWRMKRKERKKRSSNS